MAVRERPPSMLLGTTAKKANAIALLRQLLERL